MESNWAERTYRSFEQEHGEEEMILDNMANLLLHLERWCETSGQGVTFNAALGREIALKLLFDGADALMREGFEQDQVPLILQRHFEG